MKLVRKWVHLWYNENLWWKLSSLLWDQWQIIFLEIKALKIQSIVKQLIVIMLRPFRFKLCFTWLQNVVDKLLKKANVSLVVGTSSWREQFIEAITVSAGMSCKSSLHPYSKNNQMLELLILICCDNSKPWMANKTTSSSRGGLAAFVWPWKLHIDPLYHFVSLSDNCCLLVCEQIAQDNMLFTPTHTALNGPIKGLILTMRV